MKKEIGNVDAVPSKRLYLSIIADYGLNLAVSELIDNALDIWDKNGRQGDLIVKVSLDTIQQNIEIIDNAGGVQKDVLKVLVGPGQTGNSPLSESIGIFGVGTKRAVVALAQDIAIATRYQKQPTYQIEFDDKWLNTEDWELPFYQVDNIEEGTTEIHLQRLRTHISDNDIDMLRDHLGAVYARFLNDPCVNISVNSQKVTPRLFENWAYPPGFQPRRYKGKLDSLGGEGEVRVDVLAGLSKESSPATGEYGVYFYCNDRLVARAVKDYEVGFAKGLAGLPHPSASLARVIVSLNGPAQLMPWNSSKSGINYNSQTFVALRGFLGQVTKDYVSLSRRLEGQWDEQVFQYEDGDIKDVVIADLPNAKKSYLPPLPVSKLRYGERVAQLNRTVAKEKPWTIGLYEGMAAVNLIGRQKLQQRNRFALILLASTLEIGFKDYLVNESGHHYTERELLTIFESMHKVREEVKKYVPASTIPDGTWGLVEYYQNIRNKLTHERASVSLADEQITAYQGIVQEILWKLFGLQFED